MPDVPFILYRSTDNVLQLSSLTNATSGEYINDATVTAILKTSSGTTISGQTFPLTLSYVAASNGTYRGVLEDGLSVATISRAIATITVDAGNDLIRTWKMRVRVADSEA